MDISTSTLGSKSVIYVQGKFDSATRQKFNDAMRDAVSHSTSTEIEVHLGAADYIDSAACGMLLLLKKLASEAGKTVALSNATGAVKTVLSLMNFEKLFAIR
jgi:anti-anti-sigma factor